jgi:hypothetical protein
MKYVDGIVVNKIVHDFDGVQIPVKADKGVCFGKFVHHAVGNFIPVGVTNIILDYIMLKRG